MGVCNDARNIGYRIWAVPDVSIIHPTTLWHQQIWTITEINFQLNVVQGRIACDRVIPSAYPEMIDPIVSEYLLSSPDIEEKIYVFQYRKNEDHRTISIDVFESDICGDSEVF